MILVLYAFGAEMRPMLPRVADAASLQNGLRGMQGRVGNADFTMITTGIGLKRARAAAQLAFDRVPKIDLAIATGVAGALSPLLGVSHMVIADHLMVRSEDHATTEFVLEVSPQWVSAIEQALDAAGIAHSTGGILTVSRALVRSADKLTAGESSGALAVDMESAAIALEASQRGIPFACARAILDTVDHDLVGAGLANEDGRVRPGVAVKALLRDPTMIFSALRLKRNLKNSTEVLARAVEAIVRNFPG
ncbi:MAG: hypothetical protein ACREQ4_13495 [Candidatus Binataceae bacterium]